MTLNAERHNSLLSSHTTCGHLLININLVFSQEKHPLPILFLPVIELEKHKDEVFLPDRPIDLIRNGKFHKVPLIIGVTSKEGKLILPGRRFFDFTIMFRTTAITV